MQAELTEKVKDKIKKLFSLSSSSNEHEASLALKMANDLLAKHNLDMTDLDSETDMTKLLVDSKTPRNWEALIFNALCRYNYCVPCSAYRGKRIIIGRKFNADITKDQYIKITKWVAMLARNKYPGKSLAQNDYKLGCSLSITDRINKLKEEREADNSKNALIVLNSESQEFADTVTNGRVRANHINPPRQSEATHIGIMDGESIPILDALKGEKAQ